MTGSSDFFRQHVSWPQSLYRYRSSTSLPGLQRLERAAQLSPLSAASILEAEHGRAVPITQLLVAQSSMPCSQG